MRGDAAARDEAWRCALCASAIDASVGAGVSVAIGLRDLIPLWPVLQFAVVGAVLLPPLLIWRRPALPWSYAALFLNFSSGLVASMAGAAAQIARGDTAELFSAVKVAMFVIAALSPSGLFGAFWVGAYALAPVVLSFAWPPARAMTLPGAEPWMTAAYSLGALFLLFCKRRAVQYRRALEELTAERLAVKHMATLSVAIRDMGNTPLQTLNAGIAILRRRTDEEVVLARMERAVDRLRMLSRALEAVEEGADPLPDGSPGSTLARVEELLRAEPPPP